MLRYVMMYYDALRRVGPALSHDVMMWCDVSSYAVSY